MLIYLLFFKSGENIKLRKLIPYLRNRIAVFLHYCVHECLNEGILKHTIPPNKERTGKEGKGREEKGRKGEENVFLSNRTKAKITFSFPR